ncbi:MAG: hypothetical protein LC624_04315 [Halobacteriales archaeon]|nr:hypothetical protein [Halobacteriales archaeon]
MRRAALLAAPVLLLALSGCLGGAEPPVVVMSAPAIANGATIAVAVPHSIFGGGEGTASYTISYLGNVVYPPGGVPAGIDLHEGKGSVFVPYNAFVVDNGEYQANVQVADQVTRTQVAITKWVNYVYALPYLTPRGNPTTLTVDVVLEQTRGSPNDRVFAEGEMDLEIRYRGDGGVDQFKVGRTLVTDGGQSFQRFEFPLTGFDHSASGYYAAVATFHNHQAQGNNNVVMDPTLGNANPPTNWVYIAR